MTRTLRIRLFAACVAVLLPAALVHQFGWGTGALVALGFLVLAVAGWLLPVPRNGPHSDPAGQGWRGPTL